MSKLPLRQLADTAASTLASVGRLTDHIDAKLDPLMDRFGRTADAATGAMQDTDETVRDLRAQASKALRDLDAVLIEARGQLNGRGGELSHTLIVAERAVQKAETLLEALNDLGAPRSQFRADLEATMHDLAASASSLRSFAQTVERNPNSLLLGRAGR